MGFSDYQFFEYNESVADFEWRQEDDSHAQTKAEVWAAATIQLDFPTDPDYVRVFTNLDDYMKDCFEHTRKELIYFHNLKADGSYIISWLLQNKFSLWSYVDPTSGQERLMDKAIKYMPTRSFVCRINDMGQWYSITIRWKNKIVRFVDSLKILPLSVREIGKGFKTEFQKLELEYKGDRHAGGYISNEEMSYIKNDVLVMHEAIKKFHCLVGEGKMTIAAYAFEDMINTCFNDKKEYEKVFPNLSKVECPFNQPNGEPIKNCDEWIRESYHGGWTYLKPEYANNKEHTVILKNGCTADVNSLYPSKMESEYLPYGLPTWFSGPVPEDVIQASKENKLYYFVKIKTRFKLKKGKLPCIQVKNNPVYPPREWLETSDIKDNKGIYRHCYKGINGEIKKAEVYLTLTQVDYEMIKEHYELIDTEEIEGCYFKCKKGIFHPYIEKWSKIKQESKGVNPAMYICSKLMLNSCYGKLAQSDNVSYKIPYLDENGVLKCKLVFDHDIKNVKHCACASAITSAARAFTISHAQMNYKSFAYADTDSLHCRCHPDKLIGIEEHPTAFNCWKIENEWDKAVFVRAKSYIEHTVKEDRKECNPYYLVKCAGMGKEAKEKIIDKLINGEIELKDFAPGFEIAGNLKAMQINGGLILLDTCFKLR